MATLQRQGISLHYELIGDFLEQPPRFGGVGARGFMKRQPVRPLTPRRRTADDGEKSGA
jgi:hypothetical protein